jgi:hypothetical protein
VKVKRAGGASAVNTTILPEGAKLGPHGIMVLKIMKRCSLRQNGKQANHVRFYWLRMCQLS